MREGSIVKGLENCRLIDLPKISDPRGNLSFIESGRPTPFSIKRAYWIYDVPGGESRGGHAYLHLREFFVALSGSFDVVVDDGESTRTITLNRPYFGLYVPNMVWRRLENFSTNAVALILASENYSEKDYFRDYNKFLQKKLQRTP